MTRPRSDDPFGLHRVHLRRRSALLSSPLPVDPVRQAHPEADDRAATPGDADDTVAVTALGGRSEAAGDDVEGIGGRARRARRHAYDRGAERDQARSQTDESAGRPAGSLCESCPVGWVVGAWRSAEPEAIDHLLASAHELLGAIRVVVDAADAAVEAQRKQRPGGGGRVRRIDVE